MATFTPLGPASTFPGVQQPQFPTNPPATNPQPVVTFVPIEPLPGSGGSGAFAM